MDKKNLRLLLTAALLFLAILLGLEIAASRRSAQAPQPTVSQAAPEAQTPTLPPNMLPFG